MESPLALYRRYRPETFQEVIGQDHVTEPLRAALAANRVNHAYLFSGPRGCGKTTSARILARALNCAQAPISDPCGECDSCRDLARGGPGSIDVIEIDAASHGGVDDARDLREKAFFAPVRDRYKVYIIDEAHMVTTQGFNALLKLVEEPPPHLRFIFATTEPDKVLPTIRSRTHHYPFRLIPPRLLSDYLTQLAGEEGVAIEPAALPLVVRAGAGSARDTLSVLDQLLGGAGPAGVTHKLASDLLGFTPDSLLDEVVEAFATRDGAAVFSVVDKVVETGQDPRRFTEDLLRRLRDLVIVTAVPDAPATGLIDVPEDAGERLVAQAARFGAIELSRAADIVAAGLTEMRGATAPRLLLELLCARVLLPGADHTSDGVMARLERLERRHGGHRPPRPPPRRAGGRTAGAPTAAPGSTAASPAPAAPRPSPRRRPRADEPARRRRRRPGRRPAPARGRPTAAPADADRGACAAAAPAHQASPRRRAAARPPRRPTTGRGAARRSPRRPEPRRRTPPVARHPRADQEPPPPRVDGALAARPRGRRRRNPPDRRLRQRRRAGLLRQRRLRRDPAAGRDRRRRDGLAGGLDRRPVRCCRRGARRTPGGHRSAPAPRPLPRRRRRPPTARPPGSPATWRSPTSEPAPPAAPPVSAAPAREALEAARAGGGPAEPAAPVRSPDDDADPDDPDAESAALDTESLLSQTLGARLIEEIRND